VNRFHYDKFRTTSVVNAEQADSTALMVVRETVPKLLCPPYKLDLVGFTF